MSLPRIDYEHDQWADIILKQAETIQALSGMLADVTPLDAEEREKVDAAKRLENSVMLIEAFLSDGANRGKKKVSIEGVRELIFDAIDYYEQGEEPPWYQHFLEISTGMHEEDSDQA